jgi:hypothetical protein
MKLPSRLIAATCLLFASPLWAQGPERPVLTAAVLDFQSSDDRKNVGAQFSALLTAKLSQSEHLVLVERAELNTILGEMELGASGTVSPESAAKIGHLTGAKVLVTGRVFGTDEKNTYYVAKIIGTETSRVYGEAVTAPAGGSLEQPVQQLAEKILAATRDRGDTLVAKVETPEAVLERLRKSVEGKVLPSIAVEIAETHVSRPIPDPAAQTEMKLILQKVGFNVIDPARSGKKADVTIKGEALSEMGMRRGNLVSSKARVEIQIVPGDGAKPSQVDRQTEVAVDLSEHIAAKTALQKAGAKLAERLVGMLAAKP